MDEASKDMMDIVAASTALATLAAWLPPVASLFTIVWLGRRIYEFDTVKDLLNR